VRHISSTSSAFAALDAAGTVRCWGDPSSGGEMATEATEIFGNEAGEPGWDMGNSWGEWAFTGSDGI